MWWVYVLRCADDTFYVGVARHLLARVAEHNGEGRGGARYTRGRRPVALHAARACADRREATRLEWRTKRLRRVAKGALPGSEGWLAGAEVTTLLADAPNESDALSGPIPAADRLRHIP